MRAWTFALRGLVRQPGRAALGVLGVAAVGALLFDMLLLSRGLVVSLEQLLEASGFDVRVMSTQTPFAGPPLKAAGAAVSALRALPEIEDVVPLSFGNGTVNGTSGEETVEIKLMGVDPGRRRPWTVLQGGELPPPSAEGKPTLVVNRNVARDLSLSPGSELPLRASCSRERIALPAVRFRVVAVVDFPFDDAASLTAATRLPDLRRACAQEGRDEADLLLVASRDGRGRDAVRAIRAVRPDLHAFTNEELITHFQRVGFSYFRQISTVLSSVTLFFGFLLITVLLTVSVNQRFGEIATLRALGFTRRRVVQDVLCQAVLLIGTGGLLSIPLGLLLSLRLDAILRDMPDIPARLHFFVFQPRALVVHAILLALTAALAALYPMRLVARLPIAATLRAEVVS
jgi:putative ABC transport system permease protein